jgi:diphthine synthase
MESQYGKRIQLLSREEVESDPVWLKYALDNDVAFLIGGDPMVSTTHLDLRMRAIKMGIKTDVIHSSSISTAIPGQCGLQNYRFGRSTTIPFPYLARGKRIIVESPFQVLKENLSRNLHTLFFLDIQNERKMTVNEGAKLLLEMAENAKESILERTIAVGIARAGAPDATVKADFLEKICDFDFGEPLQIMIVPAKLHFMEAEALVLLAGAPAEVMDDTF